MDSRGPLAELSFLKPLLPIRVKIIRKGKLEVFSTFQKSPLILGDEKGNTIQATFSRDLTAFTEMPLEEGHCYEIKNFTLTPATERLRLSKNPHHINLDRSSCISKIDNFPMVNYYSFPHFDDLYHGLVHPKFSIDVYGAIVGVGFLEEYMTEPTQSNNGFMDHKIRFFLLNMDNVVVKCVAYGALAHVFHTIWNSINENVVLCVLQFWQINWGAGKLKNISNIDGFSKIIFEPDDVPELHPLRKKIGNGEF